MSFYNFFPSYRKCTHFSYVAHCTRPCLLRFPSTRLRRSSSPSPKRLTLLGPIKGDQSINTELLRAVTRAFSSIGELVLNRFSVSGTRTPWTLDSHDTPVRQITIGHEFEKPDHGASVCGRGRTVESLDIAVKTALDADAHRETLTPHATLKHFKYT